mgnify:CR=1 FL=1
MWLTWTLMPCHSTQKNKMWIHEDRLWVLPITGFLMLSCLLSPERLVTVPGSVIYWNKKEKAGGTAGGERLFHGWVQKQGCLENSVAVIEF